MRGRHEPGVAKSRSRERSAAERDVVSRMSALSTTAPKIVQPAAATTTKKSFNFKNQRIAPTSAPAVQSETKTAQPTNAKAAPHVAPSEPRGANEVSRVAKPSRSLTSDPSDGGRVRLSSAKPSTMSTAASPTNPYGSYVKPALNASSGGQTKRASLTVSSNVYAAAIGTLQAEQNAEQKPTAKASKDLFGFNTPQMTHPSAHRGSRSSNASLPPRNDQNDATANHGDKLRAIATKETFKVQLSGLSTRTNQRDIEGLLVDFADQILSVELDQAGGATTGKAFVELKSNDAKLSLIRCSGVFEIDGTPITITSRNTDYHRRGDRRDDRPSDARRGNPRRDSNRSNEHRRQSDSSFGPEARSGSLQSFNSSNRSFNSEVGRSSQGSTSRAFASRNGSGEAASSADALNRLVRSRK